MIKILLLALLAILVVAAVSGAHTPAIEVLEKFATQEEIEEILNDVASNNKYHRDNGSVYGFGVARVSEPFLDRLLAHAQRAANVTQDQEICALHTGRASIVKATTIFPGETPVHVDHYYKREGSPVVDDGHVGFVFLNDNDNAKFVHGGTEIPVVAGNMVKFMGNIPHNTVVKSGVVKLAGPFRLQPSLDFVGQDPETLSPSLSPTSLGFCTTNDQCNPDERCKCLSCHRRKLTRKSSQGEDSSDPNHFSGSGSSSSSSDDNGSSSSSGDDSSDDSSDDTDKKTSGDDSSDDTDKKKGVFLCKPRDHHRDGSGDAGSSDDSDSGDGHLNTNRSSDDHNSSDDTGSKHGYSSSGSDDAGSKHAHASSGDSSSKDHHRRRRLSNACTRWWCRIGQGGHSVRRVTESGSGDDKDNSSSSDSRHHSSSFSSGGSSDDSGSDDQSKSDPCHGNTEGSSSSSSSDSRDDGNSGSGSNDQSRCKPTPSPVVKPSDPPSDSGDDDECLEVCPSDLLCGICVPLHRDSPTDSSSSDSSDDGESGQGSSSDDSSSSSDSSDDGESGHGGSSDDSSSSSDSSDDGDSGHGGSSDDRSSSSGSSDDGESESKSDGHQLRGSSD